MDVDPNFALRYSVENVQKIADRQEQLIKKLNHDIIAPLNGAEKFKLRDDLMELAWHAQQMTESLEILRAKKSKSLWKRFRK